MTVFFIILGISILIILLIICSYLKINIKEFEILNTKIIKLNLTISLNLFNKIAWLKLTLNQKKIKKLQNSKKLAILNKILKTRIIKDYKNVKEIVIKDWQQILKKIGKLDVERLKLKTVIGTENAAVTAYLTGIVSAVLGIIFARGMPKIEYLVEPTYREKNHMFLSINCIITLNLVHIINIRKKLKGSVPKAWKNIQ